MSKLEAGKSDCRCKRTSPFHIRQNIGRIILGLFRRFLFRYKNNRLHTEYQFPKEQTLCYSENRIADVTKIDMMRPRKTGENFQKNMITGYSVCSKQTAILSVLSFLLSGAELTEYYSIHSGIRIGPRRTQLPLILCIPQTFGLECATQFAKP